MVPGVDTMISGLTLLQSNLGRDDSPARINVIQPSAMPEVRAINRKLIMRVELCFHRVVASPRIAGAAFEDEHAVIDGWAIEGAERVDFRRWSVLCRC